MGRMSDRMRMVGMVDAGCEWCVDDVTASDGEDDVTC